MKRAPDKHKHAITVAEERDLMATTERGEWRSVGHIDERRETLRAAALSKLEEIDRPRD
jgi:hypothetical protein